MNFTKYNVNQIIKITSHINEEFDYVWQSPNYLVLHYEEEKKTRKAGFYITKPFGKMEHIPNEKILKDNRLVILEKRIFYKPHLTFVMANEERFEMYFETQDELKSYLITSPINSLHWINTEKLYV